MCHSYSHYKLLQDSSWQLPTLPHPLHGVVHQTQLKRRHRTSSHHICHFHELAGLHTSPLRETSQHHFVHTFLLWWVAVVVPLSRFRFMIATSPSALRLPTPTGRESSVKGKGPCTLHVKNLSFNAP